MSDHLSATFDRPGRYLCAAAFGIALLGTSAAPASAGLLDFLFAPAPAAHATNPPASGPLIQPRARFKPAKRPHAAPVHAHEPMTLEQSEVAPLLDDGAVDFALNDPTLHPGDAIMTKDGIRIFEGRISPHHASSDFVPVGAARNVVSRNRNDLTQVDVPTGEVLPAQVSAAQQHKPAPIAQTDQDASRLAFARK